MKAVFCAITLAFALSFAIPASSQISKESYKQRNEMMKLNKKIQETKVSKASKKRAKEDIKDGWRASGSLLLEQQYERAAVYENSFEDDMVTPKFVHGEGMAVGEVYDGAKIQAMEIARQNLIGSIETDIAQIVDNNLSNNQMGNDDATTLTKTLTRSKSIITKKLGQTIPVIERYRRLPNGNYQVYVQTFYSMDTARKLAKDILREELEKEGQGLGEKVDELLNW